MKSRKLRYGLPTLVGVSLIAIMGAQCQPQKPPTVTPPATVAPGEPGVQPATMVDDDGQAAPGNCSATDTVDAVIQDAVDAAAVGDEIQVCPGTYAEQVTFGAGQNNITLRSVQANLAVIKAPATIVAPGALVRVNGATGVSIIGFSITGRFPIASCAESLYGIRVDGNGSATIDGNVISEIRHVSSGNWGCQTGTAILVGRNSESQVGTAVITNNTIGSYAKGGIVVDGPGSSATVTGNQVTGEGPVTYVAQNGIQVSRGATGTVSNNVVQFHSYTPAPQSTGILLYESGSGITLDGNTASKNDTNLYLTHALAFATVISGTSVTDNTLTNAIMWDGVFVDSLFRGNTFSGNFAQGNPEADCYDYTATDPGAGPGTAGTHNTWTGNYGETAIPVGICTPDVQGLGVPTAQLPPAAAPAE